MIDRLMAAMEVYQDRQPWLEARLRGVASSEISVVFGLSNWSSGFQLNWEKRGVIPFERGISPERQAEFEWDRGREQGIADWFAEHVLPNLGAGDGAKIVDPGDFAILRHPELPLSTTVERLILGPKWIRPLELKNARAHMTQHWSEEPPIIYQLQVQGQAMVVEGVLGSEVAEGYLSASIGGELPRWARMKRDAKMQAIIAERVTKFWAAVEAEKDWAIDGSDHTAKAILARWPEDDGSVVQLAEKYMRQWDKRQKIHEQIKGLEDQKGTITNQVKRAIGEATFGELPDGRRISLKTDKAGRRIPREKAAPTTHM